MNEQRAERAPYRYLVFVEVALALLVAFVASLLLGSVAFLATATLVEESGARSLLRNEQRLSIELSALDVESPPDLQRTRDAVAAALEGADLAWISLPHQEWRLLAWYAEELDPARSAQLVSDLAHLGWASPTMTEIAQRRLVSVMENPHKMKLYIPAGMTLQALCFVAVALLVVRVRRPAPVAPARRRSEALLWGALAAIAAFAASSAIGGGLQLLGIEVEEQIWIQSLFSDRGALLMLSPWLVLIGPISEELFFRGYVFRRVLDAVGPAPAYAASALLFALIHAHPIGFPMYVIIGLIFAWVYRRCGSLWAPVVGHLIYNLIVLLVPLLIAAPE